MSLWVVDEFESLLKEAALKDFKPQVTTPHQRGAAKVFWKNLGQQPAASRPGRVLKRVGSMIGRGVKETLTHGPAWNKALGAVSVADPAIQAYHAIKHPGKGRIKNVLEAVGGTAGFLAASRLPLVGNILATEAGRRAGKAIGSVVERLKK